MPACRPSGPTRRASVSGSAARSAAIAPSTISRAGRTRSGGYAQAAPDGRTADACSRRARRSLDAHRRDDGLAVAAGASGSSRASRRFAAAPASTGSSRNSSRSSARFGLPDARAQRAAAVRSRIRAADRRVDAVAGHDLRSRGRRILPPPGGRNAAGERPRRPRRRDGAIPGRASTALRAASRCWSSAAARAASRDGWPIRTGAAATPIARPTKPTGAISISATR